MTIKCEYYARNIALKISKIMFFKATQSCSAASLLRNKRDFCNYENNVDSHQKLGFKRKTLLAMFHIRHGLRLYIKA